MESIGIVLGILLGIALLVALAVLVLKVIDRITLGKDSPEVRAENARRFRERLQQPKFADLEQHFRCRIPESLRALYSDMQIVAGMDLDMEGSQNDSTEKWHIAWFHPMDTDSLKHTFFDSGKYMPIADDGFGNSYVIDPRQEDPMVLFHDHETGEYTEVSQNLSSFTSSAKRFAVVLPRSVGMRNLSDRDR